MLPGLDALCDRLQAAAMQAEDDSDDDDGDFFIDTKTGRLSAKGTITICAFFMTLVILYAIEKLFGFLNCVFLEYRARQYQPQPNEMSSKQMDKELTVVYRD